MQLDHTVQKSNYILEGEAILNSVLLKNSSWFKENHSVHFFKKEEKIYSPNDPSNNIYMIAEGRVKISAADPDGKNTIKAIFGENDVFGEMALTGEKNRTDSATALEDNTKIFTLTESEVLEMMRENTQISSQILSILGARIKRTEKRLESLLHKDARTRIIDFLRDLAIEKGRKIGFETFIKNYFTHKDMASLTGTSRQTVTTVLNELKEKNIINFDRRRILIRDMDLLV
ncbi:Crp/Fnr family transcriptional regulator [Reichenbachiella sp. MALMAid0571]|uniref:Crp/Fnr family transcriptional regulator n=1 Tax=Reichenbachiella sp. MALMAid0571 TaxID=3143939 RepID=UPI0032DE2D14